MFDVIDNIITYDRKPFAVIMVTPVQSGGWVLSAVENLQERDVVSCSSILHEIAVMQVAVNQEFTKRLNELWIDDNSKTILKALVRTILKEKCSDAFSEMELIYE